MTALIKEKFELEKKSRTFRRIDDEHQLDIYLGYSEEGIPTLIITALGIKKEIASSNLIEVKLFKKDNKRLSLTFSLLDISMETIFYKFCEDIIESSREIDIRNGLEFIINRWNSWRIMFKKNTNGLLNELQIRGLLGELIFLKKYMIPKYGENKALTAWMGPFKSHKDFEIDDTWYEIKTIKSGALTVKISSIEQLDSDKEGCLSIIVLDKSNENYKDSVSLNKYIDNIQSNMEDFDNKLLLLSKLSQADYFYDEEYDKFNYKFIECKNYKVGCDFPKITDKELSDAVVKVSYDVLISGIKKYKEDGE